MFKAVVFAGLSESLASAFDSSDSSEEDSSLDEDSVFAENGGIQLSDDLQTKIALVESFANLSLSADLDVSKALGKPIGSSDIGTILQGNSVELSTLYKLLASMDEELKGMRNNKINIDFIDIEIFI